MDIESTENSKWQRRKEERPAEIIEAALNLFVEKGFVATKLEAVAKRAGVSKGTVYLYFDSKEELFRAVIRQAIVPLLEKAEKTAAEFSGSQKDLLTKMVLNWWDSVAKTRLSGIPKLIIAEAGNFPEIAEFYLENVVDRARSMLSKIIKKGIDGGEFKPSDPGITTRLLIAPVLFAVIWEKSLAPFDHEKYNLDMYIQQHLTTFFQGICADEA